MDQASVGRRRHARLTFKRPIRDLVTATHEVRILDLSLGGGRVEHTHILRPGGMCHLRLPVGNQRLTFLCHVVWSQAIGRAEGDAGGTGLLFQSGLQFAGVSSEAHALLSAYLEGEGITAGDVADIQ